MQQHEEARGGGSRRGQDSPSSPRTPQISATELVEIAKAKLGDALGKKVYLVSGVSQGPDGGWSAEVEVTEEEHLISNFDVIGTYDARFDAEGNLLGWSRKGLRKRD